MVRNVADKTGRFRERPHYEASELDSECEGIMSKFLASLHGQATYPVSTEDLTKLIDQSTSDFDRYADLSDLDGDVEGVTDFFSDKKPVVRISKTLSEDARRENRLRTTLTHEYGHVKLHAYLFAMEQPLARLHGLDTERSSSCKRDSMLEAPSADWMEWQAGYMCGALLMPASELRRVIAAFLIETDLFPPVQPGSPEGVRMRERIVKAFQVSDDAARVRLSRLGYFTAAGSPGRSLFDTSAP